jgi:hypothetical protein
MSQRAIAIAVGLALYVAFVIAFYGLHRLAFGNSGGPYPIWYSAGELLFNAAKAVVPGVAVGWLWRADAVRTGAMVGAIGGVVEVLLLGALTGVPFSEFPGRMTVVTVVTAFTSGFTNAVGGAAGRFLRAAKPSNPLMQPTGRERPAAD